MGDVHHNKFCVTSTTPAEERVTQANKILPQQLRPIMGTEVMISAKLVRRSNGIRGTSGIGPLKESHYWLREPYKKPRIGIYIGYRRLSNGCMVSDVGEYGHVEGQSYEPSTVIWAYLCVMDDRSNPIYVYTHDCIRYNNSVPTFGQIN